MTAHPQPEVITIGPGEPVAAVVGGVHGDEPSGVWAIRRMVELIEHDEIELEHAVRLIIANPPALELGKRFITTDLNRTFPGNPEGTDEECLAAAICELIEDIPTLTLHSTRSRPTPFGFTDHGDELGIKLACRLSLPHLILSDSTEIGALGACGTVITVETGPQGTDEASEAAMDFVKEFLLATGAIPGEAPLQEPIVYEGDKEIPKPPGETYEVLVENFTKVSPGEIYARVDGQPIRAEKEFYPILMSADGYDDVLGFSARKLAESPIELLA